MTDWKDVPMVPVKLRWETFWLYLDTPRWKHWVETGKWDSSLPYIHVDEDGEIRKDEE